MFYLIITTIFYCFFVLRCSWFLIDIGTYGNIQSIQLTLFVSKQTQFGQSVYSQRTHYIQAQILLI